MSSLMFVRDGRTLPFVPVTIAAMEAIRALPKRRPYAIATYMALLEFANEDRSDRVALAQREIVARVGAGRTTVQTALDDLQSVGVLRIVERVHGNARVENEYVVIEPSDESDTLARDTGDPSPATRAANPRSTAVEVPSLDHAGEVGNGSSLPIDESEPKRVARTRAREACQDKPMTYGRQRVSAETAEMATRLLATFNEATGSRLGARKRDGSASPHLKQIIGAVMDREDEASEEDWHRAIRNTAANPPGWVDGELTIGHVFGARAAAHALANTGAIPIRAGASRNGGWSASQWDAAAVALEARGL
jgi:hypothetical protein